MLGESLRERFGERPDVPIRHEAIKLLSSETRLQILKHLDQRRMTVSELARALDLNKSTVHEHLGKLVDGGLQKRDESEEREWVYYELTKTAKYVLQPASARFVLLMGVVGLAGLLGIVLLHVALTAGQGLAVHVDEPFVAAGEARTWSAMVDQPSLLGLRQPAGQAQLYLLTAEQAAEQQLTRRLPADARLLGPEDGLSQPEPGRFEFRSTLDPGVHYLLAEGPGLPPALFPLRAEPVQVQPKHPTILVGLDPPQVEVSVRFRDAPVEQGLVQAVDDDGRELAQVPVLHGKAVMTLAQPAERVSFRFKPLPEGSSFAPALGLLHAPEPRVAFEPSVVPLRAPVDLRVVVDDPLQGPREGTPVSVVRASDGRQVAAAFTNSEGSGALQLQVNEPGDLLVKAGDLVVGRVAARPGLRLWVEPGPHWNGEAFRVRSLLLGSEPQPVADTSIFIDGREVGVTDAEGWLTLQFGLAGDYGLEARREGHVAGASPLVVLPRTGYLLGPGGASGFAGATFPGAAGSARASAGLVISEPRLLLGQSTHVAALLRNQDAMPRVLRAELRADGVLLETKAVDVPARGEAWVGFDYAPATAGVHRLQVNDLPAGQVEAFSAPPGGSLMAARAVPGPAAGLAVVAALGAALALARKR